MLGGAYSVSKSLNFNKHPEFSFLDADDVSNLINLSKAILSSLALSDNELLQVVKGVEQAILGLAPMVQNEIKELLLLFKWRPLRWITGRNESWSTATASEMDDLLNSWKDHRLQLFRGAYGALCELVNASYYASPKSWQAIGYPGPMEVEP